MEPEISTRKFWCGIKILIKNFHAVNRKIFECVIINVHKLENVDKIADINDANLINQIANATVCDEADLWGALQNISNDEEAYCLKFKFLTKNLDEDINGIGLIDLKSNSYTCKFENSAFKNFSIQLCNGKVVNLSDSVTEDEEIRWAEYVLLPKLIRWINNLDEDIKNTSITTSKSLCLVNHEKYNHIYKQLKQKHAKQISKYWEESKESTDPAKFIYEDLAIAAYLIALWDHFGVKPHAFADLGCGNGLLVYILNEEGISGYGYDVRKRKIWACYPKTIQLIEETIVPGSFKLPNDVDWILGNHSDELSAWIPVLAATLDYKMSYFLLPCCAFELSGTRFQRRNSKLSVYQDFLEYAEHVSNTCFFETLKDRLKIPSTKRVALIGLKRSYDIKDEDDKLQIVNQFVLNERSKYAYGNSFDLKLREAIEAVRNCTKISNRILEKLILKIFNLLLEGTEPQTNSIWNQGKKLRVQQIAENLTKTELQDIKFEFGGIKTLLRNKHEVFEFCEHDLVGIRRPRACTKLLNLKHVACKKKRDCFFVKNHPQGCPLNDDDCMFVH